MALAFNDSCKISDSIFLAYPPILVQKSKSHDLYSSHEKNDPTSVSAGWRFVDPAS